MGGLERSNNDSAARSDEKCVIVCGWGLPTQSLCDDDDGRGEVGGWLMMMGLQAPYTGNAHNRGCMHNGQREITVCSALNAKRPDPHANWTVGLFMDGVHSLLHARETNVFDFDGCVFVLRNASLHHARNQQIPVLAD